MIRVVVFDPIRLLCTVIASVLAEQPDIQVIGQATSLDEALAQVDNADLILINANSTNGATLNVTRSIARLRPSAKILVMGLPEIKEILLPYIEAGVAGYVPREHSVEQLVDTLRAAHANKAFVSPGVAAALMARITQLATSCEESLSGEASPLAELTPRERQILNLVRQGYSNQEIADELTIELGTVKNHIHNILRKLNVRSRHDAAAYIPFLTQEVVEDWVLD